jgi:Tol biopolymer transport system component
MLRRLLLVASIALAAACGNDPANPFNRFVTSRPPSADAVLLFVSSSWTDAPGAPREILALNADGSKMEQLTACGQSATPCDFIQAAPSPERNRLIAIRTTPDAAAGTSALYFMDLSRAVETIIFPNRRVFSADYSPDGSFVIFSAIPAQTTEGDLFYSQPNGQAEQNLTQSLTVSERNPRIDPFARTVVFERSDESGTSRIYLYTSTPLTSGPAEGPALPGTPYVVGADADPVFSPNGQSIAFTRLTGTGNGGLGTWDLLTLKADGVSKPVVIATGPLYRGAPDWGSRGILVVETDAAASRSQLVLVQPDGSGRTVLRTEDARSRMGSPRWLPGS